MHWEWDERLRVNESDDSIRRHPHVSSVDHQHPQWMKEVEAKIELEERRNGLRTRKELVSEIRIGLHFHKSREMTGESQLRIAPYEKRHYPCSGLGIYKPPKKWRKKHDGNGVQFKEGIEGQDKGGEGNVE